MPDTDGTDAYYKIAQSYESTEMPKKRVSPNFSYTSSMMKVKKVNFSITA